MSNVIDELRVEVNGHAVEPELLRNTRPHEPFIAG